MIIEWFHPERYNRFVNVTGSNINILEQFSREYNKYIRTLVQFTKNNDNTPNRIRVHLKGKSLGSDANGHLTLYGIQGLFDSVSVNVYDDHFTVLGNSLKYNLNISMNNNRIFNTGDPEDAVNKIFISRNAVFSNLHGQFDSDRHLVSNGMSVRFLGRVEIGGFYLKTSLSHRNVQDQLQIRTGRESKYYDFQHSDGTQHAPLISIGINFIFDKITSIHLKTGTNIPCVIVYKTVSI